MNKTQTFSELKEQLEKWIQPDYIQPEDIPTIDLYMDQITTFMDKQLRGNKRYEEDKIMTKTMINNYSKNALLPPSDKKKYSKDHIILLIYIYYLKNFLSISDIQTLLQPMTENYFQKEQGLTMSHIYESLFALEQQYGVQIRKSVQEIYALAKEQYGAEDDYLKTYAMIILLSYDIYAKKQLVERLIDSLKEEQGNTKETGQASKEESKTMRRELKEETKAAKRELKDETRAAKRELKDETRAAKRELKEEKRRIKEEKKDETKP